MDKDLLKKIIERIKNEEPFLGCTTWGGPKTIRLKNGTISRSLDFSNKYWDSILELTPYYGVRFDILQRWSEKIRYSYSRTWETFYCSGSFIGAQERFEYDRCQVFTDAQYAELRDTIVRCSKHFYSSVSTLEDAYSYLVAPVLRGQRSLPDQGDDWIFERCALAWLVNPADYPLFKEITKERIEYLLYGRNFKEPSIGQYEGKFDEIFDYLEHYDFSKELKLYEESLATIIN